MLDLITPLLLTYDEMPNLERTFAPLFWAKRIVVVDSGSTDGTVDWLRRDPRVALFTRLFDAHTRQWSFGLQGTAIESRWVLALDADHVLTPDLVEELRSLVVPEEVAGFECTFRYVILGRMLRGSVYPPRIVLARRDKARFDEDGHTQQLVVDGPVVRLSSPVLHDDRKPRGRFLRAQVGYASAEADKVLSPDAHLGAADRIRRLGLVAPWLVPLWCLIVKRGLLDGRAGWIYAGERAIAEWLIAMAIFERRLRR